MKPRPDTILIVDAADFGAAPGEVRLLDPDSIEHAGLSTHAISLRMAATYFRQRVGAQVLLLAIQPADVGPGRELSAEVWRAVALIEAAVCSAVPGTSRAGTAQT